MNGFIYQLRAHTVVAAATTTVAASAHLLIDGSPQWIWVTAEDVELL